MREFIFVILLVFVVGYMTLRDKKENLTPIDGSELVSFTEKVDGHKKVGICDEYGNIWRTARYSRVESYGAFFAGYDYDGNGIDIFLAGGDEVLPEINKKCCIPDVDGTLCYLIVIDKDEWQYVVLPNGKIIGPARKARPYQKYESVVITDNNLGLRSLENEIILPTVYDKIIFVSEGLDDNADTSADEQKNFVLAYKDGQWAKFLLNGAHLGDIAREDVDSLLNDCLAEAQTKRSVLKVSL